MRQPRLDRFRPPDAHDERDYEREEQIELEKADHDYDVAKSEDKADESMRQAKQYADVMDVMLKKIFP